MSQREHDLANKCQVLMAEKESFLIALKALLHEYVPEDFTNESEASACARDLIVKGEIG